MTRDSDSKFLFGTKQPVASEKHLGFGNVSAVIDDGALRCLSYCGVEMLRQIDFPVRDADWASLPPRVLHETLTETADGFQYERLFEVADGALCCRVIYTGAADGTVTAIGEATARRDFTTNRCGFTVLHPVDGFAGRPVIVRHACGAKKTLELPMLISPEQPVKDIAGLRFEVAGIVLDITFDGDVFEMEDQRNWSDASFKTYCRPLVEPFAYVIKSGETLRQTLRISLSGQSGPVLQKTAAKISISAESDEKMPQILLAVQEGWLLNQDDLEILSQSGLNRFLLRVTPENADRLLSGLNSHVISSDGAFDLEIVLDGGLPPVTQLTVIAAQCRKLGLWPDHVMALPVDFLKSYQPNGLWPKGWQPQDCCQAARDVFAGAAIGAGMLTNFTEFNRCPPDDIASDYITHCNAATVHACDDASVMQTLQTLPMIFRSARAIGKTRSYRLGLTAIGMRTNPYGDGTTPNPEQFRRTMAVDDPRARGLFGAAWAVGVLAATQGQSVQAITMAAPTGPFGILSPLQPHDWTGFGDQTNIVYPLFHVLRALQGAGRRFAVSGLPNPVAGVAVRTQGKTRLVLANLTATASSICLPAGDLAVLDTAHFKAATADPFWLEHTMSVCSAGPIELPPYAVAFCDMSSGG